MNTAPPVTFTPVHVAVLNENCGCNGTDTVGYVLCDASSTRGELEGVWAHADTRRSEAGKTFDAEHPGTVAPVWGADWSGTLAEFNTAHADHRAASARRNGLRSEFLDAAETHIWSQVGARTVTLQDGWIASCGGEYDDDHFAVTPDGSALFLLRNLGCRCGHGGGTYHDDATNDDLTGVSYLTHVTDMGVVVEALSPDNDPARLARANAAADNASARVRANALDEQSRRDARHCTSEAAIDNMTFSEWSAWNEATKPLVRGPSGAVRLNGGVRAATDWADHFLTLERRARAKAFAEHNVHLIGAPLRKGW